MRYQTSARKAPEVTLSSRWLTFQSAALYAGVSVRTLQNWEQAGCFKSANVVIPGSTRGRRLIDRESLDRFIESFIGAPASKIGMNDKREAAASAGASK